MKNMNKFFYFTMMAVATMVISCTKEGPVGPPGANGNDANETCKQCHTPSVLDTKANEYHYSLHFEGEAYEEGTRSNCAVCHSHQGFTEVCENNTPATFTPPVAPATNYTNNYVASAASLALPGKISCATCHSSLHSTYTYADLTPLTNTAAVSMTMWGGAKSINLTGSSNLCVKCHQPRPVTGSNGNVISYKTLIVNPTANYTLSTLSYRTGVHYGAHGAMFAGIGGIEMDSTATYLKSQHTATTSCKTCHMAASSGFGGGHSFSVVSSSPTATTKTINANGCNTTSCHTNMSATDSKYTGTQADIKKLINELGAKIGDILEKDGSGAYTGYLDIYDASANPDGKYKNPNASNLPVPTITNAQFAGIINLQLALRDASYGVHNYLYTKALLEKSIAKIP